MKLGLLYDEPPPWPMELFGYGRHICWLPRSRRDDEADVGAPWPGAQLSVLTVDDFNGNADWEWLHR